MRLSVLSVLIACLAMAETLLELADPGFELRKWQNSNELSAIVPEAAHTGKLGLRVLDDNPKRGSETYTAPIPVECGVSYALRYWSRTTHERSNLGVYVVYVDAAGKHLNTVAKHNELVHTVSISREWRQNTFVTAAPPEAVSMFLRVHSFNSGQGGADVDDFSFAKLTRDEEKTVKTSNVVVRNYPKPDPARIQEIEAMLSERPRGCGEPAVNRKAWKRLAATSSGAASIRKGESLLGVRLAPIPDDLYLEFYKTGNRSHYEAFYFKKVNTVMALARAECLEYKGRFMPDLEAAIAQILKDKSWVLPAHDGALTVFKGTVLYPDLFGSAITSMLAYIDWQLGDKLSPAIREGIRRESMRRTIQPWLNVIRSGDFSVGGLWWMKTNNNWNAVCTCNLVESCLILLEGRHERAEALAAMEVSNKFFLSGFTPDGYCSEGLGYWGYGFGHFLKMGEIVLEATDGKLNIFASDPVIPEVCAFARNIMIEEKVAPAFADCNVNATPSVYTLAIIQRHFPQALLHSVNVFDGVAEQPLDLIGILGFSDDAAAIAKAPQLPLWPGYTFFKDAGILICRSMDPDRGRFGTAIKGGHNAEMHNHNDVGSYLVVLNGKSYLIDPGTEPYTKRTFSRERYVSNILNSYGHPVPVVVGKLQQTGHKARGIISNESFTQQESRIDIDMTAAYDVPELLSLVRRFTFDRLNWKVVVKDTVEFKTPQTFGGAMITYSKYFRRKDGDFVFYDAKGSLLAHVETEGVPFSVKTEMLERGGATEPLRVGINLDKPVLKATMTFTICAAPLSDELPGLYKKPDTSKLKPRDKGIVTVEAENFTAQVGGDVVAEHKVASSNDAIKLWDHIGHALTWTFEVPTEGRYAIMVRFCHARQDPVERHLFVDGTRVDNDGELLFPGTGGWSRTIDNWQENWLSLAGRVLTFPLKAGKHEVKMLNVDGYGLNLDWISLVPVDGE